ncbi:hypothetical protein H5410_010772 [Solanum commersonii]|uniref:Uncharacterized protein n=1 Tax=Solanum commersonii TaxID=4109 RepID=A0A9J6AN52_SOLCO|nr:hypothetical protein H5410_010772 [Solanum commersonii]
MGGKLLQKFVWLNILVFHFLITLALKKGFDSGPDLDTILQILVAPRYGLQDEPLEVPSGHLNSSPVVNWKTVLLNKDREQGWDLAFRRLVNDWELERVVELLGKIGGMSMDTISTDKMLWKH